MSEETAPVRGAERLQKTTDDQEKIEKTKDKPTSLPPHHGKPLRTGSPWHWQQRPQTKKKNLE